MNTSLRTLKVSMMGVVMPDMVPIMLPRPRLISIKKNMTDQKGEAGKWVMASVKAMKARPVPCTDCWVGRGPKDEEKLVRDTDSEPLMSQVSLTKPSSRKENPSLVLEMNW